MVIRGIQRFKRCLQLNKSELLDGELISRVEAEAEYAQEMHHLLLICG